MTVRFPLFSAVQYPCTTWPNLASNVTFDEMSLKNMRAKWMTKILIYFFFSFIFFERLKFQYFCTNSAVVPRTLPFKAESKVSEPRGSSLRHIILWFPLDQSCERTAKNVRGSGRAASRMFATDQLVLVKFAVKRLVVVSWSASCEPMQRFECVNHWSHIAAGQ